MKRVSKTSNILGMAKEPSRGVFWIVDRKVLSFPFYHDTIFVNYSQKRGSVKP